MLKIIQLQLSRTYYTYVVLIHFEFKKWLTFHYIGKKLVLLNFNIRVKTTYAVAINTYQRTKSTIGI